VQKAVREAVAESAAAIADYRAGSERALNFIVGQVMKKTRGRRMWRTSRSAFFL